MSTFALAVVDEVEGIVTFRKLTINGRCQFDEFCQQIEQQGNLIKQLIGIFNTLNQVANLRRLPREKFRDITPSRERVREFEIKKGDLRVYVIKEEGHIIILGGKKSAQDEDIRKFRSMKRRYIESKNQTI